MRAIKIATKAPHKEFTLRTMSELIFLFVPSPNNKPSFRKSKLAFQSAIR